MEIPTVEPREVTLGETIKWIRADLSDFPSPTWTLTYYFVSRDPSVKFSVVASAYNGGFLVDLGAATGVQSSFERVGQSGYEWAARVSQGTEKYTIGQGVMSIAPDVATLTGGVDRRTWAMRTRDVLRQVIEGRADADVNMYMIAGKQVQKMTPEELQNWYRWISGLAAADEAKLDPTATGGPRTIKARLLRGY